MPATIKAKIQSNQSLNPAEVYLGIEEELSYTNGLAADIHAIQEIAMLLSENRDCNPLSLSHVLSVLTEQSLSHIAAITRLNEQLRG